jgi:hypothetical protein
MVHTAAAESSVDAARAGASSLVARRNQISRQYG